MTSNPGIRDEEFIDDVPFMPFITVKFDIEPLYMKKQCRQAHRKGMRIEDGIVTMYVTSTAQISDVVVEVCRTPEAAQEFGSVPVPLSVKYVDFEAESQTWKYEIDLDSVFQDQFGREVYKLKKAGTEHWNKFYLQAKIQFADGSIRQDFFSPMFKLKSMPKKRKNPDLNESTDSEESPPSTIHTPPMEVEDTGRYSSCSIPSSESNSLASPNSLGSDFTNSYTSFPGNTGESNSPIITSYLNAQTAKIGSLTVTDILQVPGGDIAYHLPLADPEKLAGKLEEGDVVGFFPVDSEKTIIEPLTMNNCERAVLAGVITRSAYLHAMTPIKKGTTDTVCVIGMVKVKVKGSVQHGERIYASCEDAGIAIPESHLPLSAVLFKNQTLLGMAMEGAKPKVLDEVNLVQCFVCIVLGITTKQQAKAVEDMYDNIRMDSMVEIRKESKKTKKHFWLILSIAAVIVILLSVFFYQWFHPGSALRYYMCEQGSIPDHTAQFKYIPYRDKTQRVLVKGVEFGFQDLMHKLELTSVPRINTTMTEDPHYYLNIDRCAYGGPRYESKLDKAIEVGGPEIFAVNHNCTAFFYYDSYPVDEWVPYKSEPAYFVEWRHCDPPLHGKGK